MQYYSTNGKAPIADLQKAVVKGLAEDKGLYMPDHINTLPKAFFDNIQDMSFQDIAYNVASAFFGDDVDLDNGCKNDYSLPFGTCILVQAMTTGAYITSNGEVVQPEDQQIVTELVSTEWKYIGNCTPVARTLKDFVPGNGWGYGNDLIKILTKDATLDFNAVYYTWDSLTKKQQKGRDKETFVEGWYKIVGDDVDLDKGCKNDTPIPAGSGFLAQSMTTGATITQPSAL